MIRMSVESLLPGMTVGKAVQDDKGHVLLNRNVELTDRFIQSLEKRSIAAIYIQDGNTDDIIPDESISEVVRGSTIRNMRKVFNSIEGIKKEIKEESQKTMQDHISSGRFKDTFKNTPGFEKLTSDMIRIVDELVNVPTIMLGMNSLKTYNDYIYQHSTDVAITSIMIGRRIGLSMKRLAELGKGCLMMDIGNIFIPESIIDKPGKLTKEEFKLIKEHPVVGYEILKEVQGMGVLAPHVAFQHHERQDGKGYPRGITGNNSLLINEEPKTIHLYASIAAVADVFDALSSDKSYRKAFPPEKVVGLMRKRGGTHFNKEVLKTFLSITPLYPEGSTIKVVRGKFRNYIGVVEKVNPEKLAKPVIRLILNPDRRPIKLISIDTDVEKNIGIESILL